ncbi:MAG TPA: hypothetical protein VI299_01290 [Polyangiales bacterium]
MKRSHFLRLASDHGIEKSVPFSQRAWRRRHYAVDPGKLCSGLIYFWLDALLRRGRPLQQLRAPDDDTLRHIHELQATSYYPSFSDDHLPTEEDCALLERKYGTPRWSEVRERIRARAGGDAVLYDLATMFDFDAATVSRFEQFPDVLPDCALLPRGSAVIAVLRYRQSGVASGHRIAWFCNADGRHYFFDPNAGAVIESRATVFRSWIDAYYEAADYPIFSRPEDGASLRLYQLHGARSARPELAAHRYAHG